jgi:hypothetical protein
MKLTLGYLYPDLLNIYGDRGNILTLEKRCQWRDIDFKVIEISLDQSIPLKKIDLFFGGGGQDRQQLIVADDLQKKQQQLLTAKQENIPMLTICGTYQLFGKYFLTKDKTKVPGINLFNAYTTAGDQRNIGNIAVKLNNKFIKNSQVNTLVGFENHSGNTYINNNKTNKDKTLPLGTVQSGTGNNQDDNTAGAVCNNVIGSYLHGPLLPRNPHLADYLIKTALEVKYQKEVKLKKLTDKLEWQAHQTAVNRTYHPS